MLKKFVLFITLSLLFNLISIYGNSVKNNDIKFEKITQRNGLSQGSISCIIQDKKGFMWFGTQNGLNKYDGYKFEVFLNEPNDPSSISFNTITSLFEDSKGNLWIGTQIGLNRYIASKKKFVRYFASNSSNSISNNNITAISEDKNNDIWIGTQNGLNRYNYNTDSFKRYMNNNKEGDINNNRISVIYKSRNETLWIGTTGGGVNKYISNKDSFINYYSDSDNIINFITAIYEDHSGEFWIGTRFGGIAIFDTKKGVGDFYRNIVNDPDSLSDNRVNFFFESRNRMLWVGTQNGLNRFNRRMENFYVYKNNLSNPFSLSMNNVISIYEDRNGILWVGTNGKGLNKYTKKNVFFKNYIPEPYNKNSINDGFIRPIFEDKNKNLWIGTQNSGINKINRKLNEFSLYRYRSSDNMSISSDSIFCFYEDNDNKIWIGTNGNGLNKYDQEKDNFTRYVPGINSPLGIRSIRHIISSKNNSDILWLATVGRGIIKFNKKNNTFEEFYRPANRVVSATKNQKIKYEALNSNTVFYLYESDSKPNQIWLTTNRGFNSFDIEKEDFIKYGNNLDPINNYVMMGILEHSKYPGFVWIGSMGNGLIKFNINTGKIETIYTVKDGLPDNVVYGVLEDINGYIWLSTNKGLSKFNIERKSFFNFDVEDGLQGMEFNGNSFFKSSSGEMFFGGINGLSSFFPDKIRKNKMIPKIYITDFKVFDESIKVGENSILSIDITETKQITLPYYKNTFTFEFVALDFTAPRKNKYAYILKNFEDIWHHVVYDKRSVQYMNLNPGEYIFNVIGSNNDGVWNKKGAEIKIIIKPPFWNTWSFRLSISLFVILMFLVLYKKRMSNISSRLRLETELNAAHKAQMSIMPQSDPEIDGFDISGLCVPANEVGGDFYDYLWLDNDKKHFGIAIGDVSGKAMKAAMTAIMTNGMLFLKASESSSIKEIMTGINKPIYLKTEKQVFTALCLVSIGINSKIMSFANAGLNEPIIKHNNDVTRIKQKGIKFPLGIQENSEYIEKEIQLRSGDTLLLYTDGVSEAINSKNEFYSIERLLDLLKNIETDKKGSKEIVDCIMNDIDNFTNTEPQRDDITIVVVKVK